MINRFSGQYSFLSNFHVVENGIICKENHRLPIPFNDYFAELNLMSAPTAEHLFQAAKTRDANHRRTILLASTPGAAKRLGRHYPLVPGWNELRLDVMRLIISCKFHPETHLDLATALLATGTENLVEGNTWNDRFWGVDINTGHGENHLGRTLMWWRDVLRSA